MMKKTIYIIAAVLIFFTSCKEEWLEVSPSDALNPANAFTTIADAQTALNGVYSALQDDEYYGADLLSYASTKGDACRTYQSGRRTFTQYAFQETADANKTGLWIKPYNALMLINNMLERIDVLETTSDEEAAEKNNLKGQALTLRAFCHFDLVKVYGIMPENGNPATDLGVPIADKVLAPDEKPVRSTVAQVYDFIIADLEAAIPLMSTDVGTGTFNKYGAQALLGRVCLYNNDNAKALSNSEAVISSGAYQLLTVANYASSWHGGATSETIYEIVNTLDDTPEREGYYYLWTPDPDGYGAIALTDDMVSTLRSDLTDVRSTLAQDYRGDGAFNYLAKWTNTYDNNFQIIRLSEVYLNACEAAFKTGNTASALNYINTLVENRTGVADTYTSLTLETILDERNKELVGEGHRFFDLMRNGLPVVRTGSDHAATAPLTIAVDDFRVIQPIPRLETDVNTNLTQNPQY